MKGARTMCDRKAALCSLIEFDQPLDKIREALAGFDWDYDGDPLAILSAKHVLRVLNRYARGEIDATAVEDWAELIECRDGLDFEDGREEWGRVRRAIHVLANPYLEGTLADRLSDLTADMNRLSLRALPGGREPARRT